jgi:hypothetical protein
MLMMGHTDARITAVLYDINQRLWRAVQHHGSSKLATAKRARMRILARKLIYRIKLNIGDLIVSWQSDL